MASQNLFLSPDHLISKENVSSIHLQDRTKAFHFDDSLNLLFNQIKHFSSDPKLILLPLLLFLLTVNGLYIKMAIESFDVGNKNSSQKKSMEVHFDRVPNDVSFVELQFSCSDEAELLEVEMLCLNFSLENYGRSNYYGNTNRMVTPIIFTDTCQATCYCPGGTTGPGPLIVENVTNYRMGEICVECNNSTSNHPTHFSYPGLNQECMICSELKNPCPSGDEGLIFFNECNPEGIFCRCKADYYITNNLYLPNCEKCSPGQYKPAWDDLAFKCMYECTLSCDAEGNAYGFRREPLLGSISGDSSEYRMATCKNVSEYSSRENHDQLRGGTCACFPGYNYDPKSQKCVEALCLNGAPDNPMPIETIPYCLCNAGGYYGGGEWVNSEMNSNGWTDGHYPSCVECTDCASMKGRIEISPCTLTADATCGCKVVGDDGELDLVCALRACNDGDTSCSLSYGLAIASSALGMGVMVILVVLALYNRKAKGKTYYILFGISCAVFCSNLVLVMGIIYRKLKIILSTSVISIIVYIPVILFICLRFHQIHKKKKVGKLLISTKMQPSNIPLPPSPNIPLPPSPNIPLPPPPNIPLPPPPNIPLPLTPIEQPLTLNSKIGVNEKIDITEEQLKQLIEDKDYKDIFHHLYKLSKSGGNLDSLDGMIVGSEELNVLDISSFTFDVISGHVEEVEPLVEFVLKGLFKYRSQTHFDLVLPIYQKSYVNSFYMNYFNYRTPLARISSSELSQNPNPFDRLLSPSSYDTIFFSGVFRLGQNIYCQKFAAPEVPSELKVDTFITDFDKTLTLYHLYRFLRSNDFAPMVLGSNLKVIKDKDIELFKDLLVFYTTFFGGTIRMKALRHLLSGAIKKGKNIIIITSNFEEAVLQALRFLFIETKYLEEVYVINLPTFEESVGRLLENPEVSKCGNKHWALSFQQTRIPTSTKTTTQHMIDIANEDDLVLKYKNVFEEGKLMIVGASHRKYNHFRTLDGKLIKLSYKSAFSSKYLTTEASDAEKESSIRGSHNNRKLLQILKLSMHGVVGKRVLFTEDTTSNFPLVTQPDGHEYVAKFEHFRFVGSVNLLDEYEYNTEDVIEDELMFGINDRDQFISKLSQLKLYVHPVEFRRNGPQHTYFQSTANPGTSHEWSEKFYGLTIEEILVIRNLLMK